MANKSFVLVDETVNTYGGRVLVSGANLKQFERNPVGFYIHEDCELPIIRWENIRIEDGKILADPVFDMEDEFATKVAGKVERDFIRMASVGLVVIAVSNDPKLMLPGQTEPTITKWRLREASIVPLGANHNALRLFDEAGTEISLGDKETVLRLSDGYKQPIPNKQNFSNNMTQLDTILKLSDKPTEEQRVAAAQALADKANTLEVDNKTLSDKVAAYEAAEKAKKQQEAMTLTDAAIKDGRLNAKGANGEDNRAATLALFDKDFDGTKAMLAAIPAREAVSKKLNDGAQGQPTMSAWDKRMKEINGEK